MSPRYSNVTTNIRGFGYAMCITQSQFIYSIQQKVLKGKTRFIEKKERGKTPYDSSIATKPSIHQDRAIKNTREREIQHIATGTYPQPRGRTTPSSSWRPPG